MTEDLRKELKDLVAKHKEEMAPINEKINQLTQQRAKLDTTLKTLKFVHKQILEADELISRSQATKDILFVNELFDEFYRRTT